MRLTQRVIKSRARKPFPSLSYLDLSGLGLLTIENLDECHKLDTLVLSHNNLQSIESLTCLRQLWHLDLSNNKLLDVGCLERFVALGTLNLANNSLDWTQLGKIQHVHVLNLHLHGNSPLEREPYYRIHVVDCLPHVWMLDGKLISSVERLQVDRFFHESAYTDRPARHKLSDAGFIPTSMKNIHVNGIFGNKTDHMLRRFPADSCAMNTDMDMKRLYYLAYNIQSDVLLACKYRQTKETGKPGIMQSPTFLEDLLEQRESARGLGNLLLLLLLASLEFSLPVALMKDALEVARLLQLGEIYTMDLFLLPRDLRCTVVTVLISALKVDKDNREDGGLNDRLYLCLNYLASDLNRLTYGPHRTGKRRWTVAKRNPELTREYRWVLGAEVIQLFNIVPAFFEYAYKDPGVMQLLKLASKNKNIVEELREMMISAEQKGENLKDVYKEIANYILKSIQESADIETGRTSQLGVTDLAGEEVLPTARLNRPKSSPIYYSAYHTRGATSPDLKPTRVLSGKPKPQRTPKLGDEVLIKTQTIGYILSLPEHNTALVQLKQVPPDMLPSVSSLLGNARSEQKHHVYVDLDRLYFDEDEEVWKPRDAVGDAITLQVVSDAGKEEEEQEISLSRAPSRAQSAPRTPRRRTASPAPPPSHTSPEPPRIPIEPIQTDSQTKEHPQAKQVEPDEQNIEDSVAEAKSVESKRGASPTTSEGASHQDSRPGSALNPIQIPSTEAVNIVGLQEAGEGNKVQSQALNEESLGRIDSEKKVQKEPSQSARTATVATPRFNEDVRPKSAKFPISLMTPKSGLSRTGRPMSAMEVTPVGVTSRRDVSAYQEQRIEQWRRSASEIRHAVRSGQSQSLIGHSTSTVLAPPQRPTTPLNKELKSESQEPVQPSIHGNVLWANEWLAGGRDLHWEAMQQLPVLTHEPGWKEGAPAIRPLPRPRTSYVPHRRNSATEGRGRPASNHSPTSIKYNEHGNVRGTNLLPTTVPLTDYRKRRQITKIKPLGYGLEKLTCRHSAQLGIMCGDCAEQLMLDEWQNEQQHVLGM